MSSSSKLTILLNTCVINLYSTLTFFSYSRHRHSHLFRHARASLRGATPFTFSLNICVLSWLISQSILMILNFPKINVAYDFISYASSW